MWTVRCVQLDPVDILPLCDSTVTAAITDHKPTRVVGRVQQCGDLESRVDGRRDSAQQTLYIPLLLWMMWGEKVSPLWNQSWKAQSWRVYTTFTMATSDQIKNCSVTQTLFPEPLRNITTSLIEDSKLQSFPYSQVTSAVFLKDA